MSDRAVKKMRKDKAAGEGGGGHQSDDNANSVSVNSKIDSDEWNSDDEDFSDAVVKEESTDEEDAAAPIASTSRGQKRQKSASGNYKKKTISINCPEANCQRTFRHGYEMRAHLLPVHNVMPFPCHAQGCGEQFDKSGEFCRHARTHARATTTWLCPDCPGKTFTSGRLVSNHISDYHRTGRFQCAVDQCQFTGTTRQQVHNHQISTHSSAQHTCSFDGCTRSFTMKSALTIHQRTHTLTTPFRCTVANCGYKAKQRCDVVRHIRTVHFHLPATLKEQHYLGIIDHRDPNDFIEEDEEALRLERQ